MTNSEALVFDAIRTPRGQGKATARCTRSSRSIWWSA